MTIKILYFQAHPVYGATENYLYTLADKLNKVDFQVGILYPDVRELEIFNTIVQVQSIPVNSKYFTGNLLAHAYYLAKEIKKFSPDIVHVNDPSPLGVITAHFAGVKKIIITHHTPRLQAQYNWKGRLAKKIVFRLTNYFIFTSPHDQETGTHIEKISTFKSRIIPYGLETSKFNFSQEQRAYLRTTLRDKLSIPQDDIVIASAGRLETQKAQQDLIQVAKIITAMRNKITFVIFGEGSLRSNLEAQIYESGLEKKFLLPGFVDNIADYLCTVDIFTMSSLFEGLCYAVVEAAAMSIPVVSTNIGGMCYSIADNETGILIEPSKPIKLVEKINWLLDNSDIAQDMGNKGRKRFLELFTVDTMVTDTAALYHELI